MNVSYSGLWKILGERGMLKTELAELTGMSSRTLAKLSKNEYVSLETIAKICEVLHCGIENVVTLSGERGPVSLYDAFNTRGELVEEKENVLVYLVEYMGMKFRVNMIKREANRFTVIRCENDTVKWEQMPLNWKLRGMFMGETEHVMTLRAKLKKGETTLVVIPGKPETITGLDDGIFRSARYPGGENFLHVMTQTAFKAFEPIRK